MTTPGGTIAIMGSGETTDSMVRVHRYLLERLKPPVRAVFIDTPAGFQMNAEDLFDKAREYFQKRLNQPLLHVSFKSAKNLSAYEAEKAYRSLRDADYLFVGPGSPTYALKNWAGTPIPQIIQERIQEGGIFVAASAAALTLGSLYPPRVRDLQSGGRRPLGGRIESARPIRPSVRGHSPLEQRRRGNARHPLLLHGRTTPDPAGKDAPFGNPDPGDRRAYGLYSRLFGGTGFDPGGGGGYLAPGGRADGF